jgi:hypothetical protein
MTASVMSGCLVAQVAAPTLPRPTISHAALARNDLFRVEMQDIKGVQPSEVRPAGTGLSRPEAAVESD